MSAITSTAIATVIAAGASSGAGIYAAHKASSTAEHAADETTKAQNYAQQLQDQANQRALEFSKQQQENAFQNSEVARRGNYDQWAAAQRRLRDIGTLIGVSDREIPAYVPGVDPNFTGGGVPGGSATAGGATRPLLQLDGSKPLDAQIAGYLKQHGGDPAETPYWISKWGELTARGQELGDPTYAAKRLAAADSFGGAPASTAGPTVAAGPRGLPSYQGTPFAPVSVAAGVRPIGSYL